MSVDTELRTGAGHTVCHYPARGLGRHLQRTFAEECYRCLDVPLRVPDLAAALRAYEEVDNTIRPHHALGYRTPAQYLADLETAA